MVVANWPDATPACVAMNASGSRSPTGSRRIWSIVTVVEISVLVVCTVSAPALTSTDVAVVAKASFSAERSVLRDGSTFTLSNL